MVRYLRSGGGFNGGGGGYIKQWRSVVGLVTTLKNKKTNLRKNILTIYRKYDIMITNQRKGNFYETSSSIYES